MSDVFLGLYDGFGHPKLSLQVRHVLVEAEIVHIVENPISKQCLKSDQSSSTLRL